jgi:hypothetical protein
MFVVIYRFSILHRPPKLGAVISPLDGIFQCAVSNYTMGIFHKPEVNFFLDPWLKYVEASWNGPSAPKAKGSTFVIFLWVSLWQKFFCATASRSCLRFGFRTGLMEERNNSQLIKHFLEIYWAPIGMFLDFVKSKSKSKRFLEIYWAPMYLILSRHQAVSVLVVSPHLVVQRESPSSPSFRAIPWEPLAQHMSLPRTHRGKQRRGDYKWSCVLHTTRDIGEMRINFSTMSHEDLPVRDK